MPKPLAMWLRRFFRQWPIVIEIIFFGLFLVGDSAGVVKDTTGHDPDRTWIFLAGLIAVGVTAIWRLMSLEARIDNRESVRNLISELNADVARGGQLADMYARPGSNLAMSGATKDIYDWTKSVNDKLAAQAPDFVPTWGLDVIDFSVTKDRSATAQMITGRQQRLGEIIHELRMKQ